ncbi:MAG: hypothetical protein HZA64_13895 [Rhodocyclales bacterium]|nr:hypothetical protein [Rhodocyclales bacterium]
MSRWSTEALHVHCGPEGALALTRVGWRRSFGAARHFPMPAGETRWSAALAGLAAALAEHPGKPVRVVLANRLAQFRIIPWRDHLPGEAEYRALAQLEFADAFGSLADGWAITLSDEAPGRARIAAAISGELLAAIKETAAAHRSRLLGVSPALTIAAGLWPSAESEAPQCLVAVEPGQLGIAVHDGQDWRWLRQMRVDADWADRLPQLLRDESHLANLELTPEATRVFAPEANRDELGVLQGHGFAGIDLGARLGFPVGGDIKYLTAWCA